MEGPTPAQLVEAALLAARAGSPPTALEAVLHAATEAVIPGVHLALHPSRYESARGPEKLEEFESHTKFENLDESKEVSRHAQGRQLGSLGVGGCLAATVPDSSPAAVQASDASPGGTTRNPPTTCSSPQTSPAPPSGASTTTMSDDPRPASLVVIARNHDQDPLAVPQHLGQPTATLHDSLTLDTDTWASPHEPKATLLPALLRAYL
ncbi:hypothetical protein V8C86DRAFT_2461157, partial [Haematococcus lacustris]